MKKLIFVLLLLLALPTVSGVWNSTFETGLLNYYNFEESPSNIVRDIIGGNNLTIYVGEIKSGGVIGNMFNVTNGINLNATTVQNISDSITGNNPRTINFWSFTNVISDQQVLLEYGRSSANGLFSFISSGTGLNWTVQGNSGANDYDTGTAATTGLKMHTLTHNGTTLVYYVDSVIVGAFNHTYATLSNKLSLGVRFTSAQNYNGTMDELGIWNRSLSASEVTDLYNSGSPISPPSNRLDAPTDNARLTATNLFFSAEYGNAIGFLNTTLFVWDSSGALFNTNFANITGLTNSSNLSLSSFTLRPEYSWNYFVCLADDSCSYVAELNRTFDYGLSINREVFNSNTVEGVTEEFSIDINIPSTSSITSAILVYNNTENTATVNQLNSSNYNITEIRIIQDVAGNTVQSFYWSFIIDGFQFNTTTQSQSVNTISLDNCASNTILLYNLTIRDEETQIIVTSPENTTIEVDIDIYTQGDRSSPIVEFSQNYTNSLPAKVCLNEGSVNSSSFEVDAVFKYVSSGREVEFHNIQNFTLTNANIPQDISFYDLNTADSQVFLITFKDDSFSPVEDALITITRKYIQDGVFRTVEAPLTDSDGQALAHLVIADVIYTIQVSKHGEVLATFDNIVAFCSDVTIGQCEINLDSFSSGINPTDYTTINDLFYTMSFNKVTRTITVVFTVPSGASATMDLNATLFDNRGNTTVCNTQVVSSSGTLNCIVPLSYGNSTILSTLHKDGGIINSATYRISQDVSDLFGGTGYLFLLLLYMTLPLMMITTRSGMIIAGVVGLIFGALLNMFNTNNIIGVGSTIVWFIVAGGIIAFKVVKRE